MAKKNKEIITYIKLQVPAGAASPSPPVGPALGQHGVNLMDFCNAFNSQTNELEKNLPVPVVITVYEDRSFDFIVKTTNDIKLGEDLADSYGSPNTNHKYLMHYGFTLEDNPYDVVKLNLNGTTFDLNRNNIGTYGNQLDKIIDDQLMILNKKHTSHDINFHRIIESEKRILTAHHS